MLLLYILPSEYKGAKHMTISEWEKITYQPKALSDIIDHAYVVIDTNLLLAAYQWREVTVHQVINSLKAIADKGRLKIPSQVVKEFGKRRPGMIKDAIEKVHQIAQKLETSKEISEAVPALTNTESFQLILDAQEKYKASLHEYRKLVLALRNQVMNLMEHDHILEEYKTIFEKSYFHPPGLPSEIELEKEFDARSKLKIPPGYEDAGKTENRAGDYITWSQILTLDNDTIFVSAEKKTDWVMVDPHGSKVYSARRELIEEFYLKTGSTFRFVSPKEFVSLLKPDLNKEVKDDLEATRIPISVSNEREELIDRLFNDTRPNWIFKNDQKVLDAYGVNLDSLKRAINVMKAEGKDGFSTIDFVRYFNNGNYRVNTDINNPMGKYIRDFSTELQLEHVSTFNNAIDDYGNSTTTQIWRSV